MAQKAVVQRMIGFTQAQWQMITVAFGIGSQDGATKLREVLFMQRNKDWMK